MTRFIVYLLFGTNMTLSVAISKHNFTENLTLVRYCNLMAWELNIFKMLAFRLWYYQ